MTVCAAAICCIQRTAGEEQLAIVGISDRMYTSGDIEFETRHQTKIHALLPAKASILGAGDSATNFAVSTKTHEDMKQAGVFEIEAIARLHGDNYATFRKERLEKEYLFPLGLDMDSFVARQNELQPSLAMELADRLLNEDLDVESIVCGFDEKGPHIYQVSDRGQLTCHNGSGFYAIGAGARQLESLFMFHGYDVTWTLPEALFLIYSAKVRAESSPGVGEMTDMFILDNKNGFKKLLPIGAMVALDEHYQSYEVEANRVRNLTIQKIADDQRIPKIITDS